MLFLFDFIHFERRPHETQNYTKEYNCNIEHQAANIVFFFVCLWYLNIATLNQMCISLCNLHYDRKLHSIWMPRVRAFHRMEKVYFRFFSSFSEWKRKTAQRNEWWKWIKKNTSDNIMKISNLITRTGWGFKDEYKTVSWAV